MSETKENPAIVNGAPVPKCPDGSNEPVDHDTFNMCGDCGEQVDTMGDAFGTHWASCYECCNGELPSDDEPEELA
jgi:hypothetical protein